MASDRDEPAVRFSTMGNAALTSPTIMVIVRVSASTTMITSGDEANTRSARDEPSDVGFSGSLRRREVSISSACTGMAASILTSGAGAGAGVGAGSGSGAGVTGCTGTVTTGCDDVTGADSPAGSGSDVE